LTSFGKNHNRKLIQRSKRVNWIYLDGKKKMSSRVRYLPGEVISNYRQ